MSRTDKTNPSWVKMLRREGNVKPWQIWHNHNKHAESGCNPVVVLPETYGRWRFVDCEVWPRHTWSELNRIYGRHPNRETRRLLGFEGRNRMLLRRLRRDWRLEPVREDIDSTLWAPRRRCQVRDTWRFD